MTRKEQRQLIIGKDRLIVKISISGVWKGVKPYINHIYKTKLKIIQASAIGSKNEKYNTILLEDNHKIVIEFPRPFYAGDDYSFIIEIEVDMSFIVKLGLLNILEWPQEQLLQIVFLPDAGPIFFNSTLAKIETNPINKYRLISISQLVNSLTSHIKRRSAVRVEWGTSPIIRLIFNYEIENKGDLDVSNITILSYLPPNTQFQEAYISKLKKIRRDDDNNSIGIQIIEKLEQNRKCQKSFTIDIKPKGNKKAISSNVGTWEDYKNAIAQNYVSAEMLKPSKYWNTDDESIQSLVNGIKKKIHNPSEFIIQALKFVNQNIKYEINYIRENAANTLENRNGDCSEFSDLFVTLLRSVGIPAKIVKGWILEPIKHILENHQWSEYYSPNLGWIQCDPTMGYLNGVSCQHICRQREGIIKEQPTYAYGFDGKTDLKINESIDYELIF